MNFRGCIFKITVNPILPNVFCVHKYTYICLKIYAFNPERLYLKQRFELVKSDRSNNTYMCKSYNVFVAHVFALSKYIYQGDPSINLASYHV